MPSIFLSHSSRDKQLARRIANELTNVGVDVWLDEWNILVGDSISQQISHGLERSDFVAVVLTENSIKSGWVEKEWQAKIGQEATDRKVTVLPIRVDECPIPVLLSDKRFADFRYDFHAGLAELREAIKGHLVRSEETTVATKTIARPVRPAIVKSPHASDTSRSARTGTAFTLAPLLMHMIVVVLALYLCQDWWLMFRFPDEAETISANEPSLSVPATLFVFFIIGGCFELTAIGMHLGKQWSWRAGVVMFLAAPVALLAVSRFIINWETALFSLAAFILVVIAGTLGISTLVIGGFEKSRQNGR